MAEETCTTASVISLSPRVLQRKLTSVTMGCRVTEKHDEFTVYSLRIQAYPADLCCIITFFTNENDQKSFRIMVAEFNSDTINTI